MNRCDVVQAAILDEALPRPSELEAHLESCAECRAVAAAHRSALRLSGARPSLGARRPLPEVRRRAGAVVGLAIAFVGAVGWWWLEATAPAPRPVELATTPVEREGVQHVVAEAPAPEAGLFALAALQLDVELTLRRDPRRDPLASKIFGALPEWTEPTRTRPLRALGKFASPLVVTQEDSR
ncbi:MAG: hypothetical protein ACOZQL_29935 [Myxococcota bacterium]